MQDVALTNDGQEEGLIMSDAVAKESSLLRKMIPWFICTLGAVFYFYEYLLRVAPSVMTTDLMLFYHISAASLGNLAAFYYYVYTPMQLPVGVLMDRYGPRRLLTLAVFSCALGTYFFAATHNLFVAELGRFLVGFGSAFAFVGALKLATVWLPPDRFAMVSGMMMALGQVGAMVGAIALTSFVHHEGWQWTSYFTATAGIVLTIVMYGFIRDRNKAKQQTQSAEPLDNVEPTTFAGVLSRLVMIIRDPQIWINGAIGCMLYIPTSVFAELWGIPYLKAVHHMSSMQAARVISMIFLGWAIGGPIVGWISDYIRLRRLPMTVGCFVAAILLSFVFYWPHFPVHLIGPTFLVFGMFSSTQVIVFPVGREISPKKAAGTAIALTNMLVMIGGMLLQPLVGVLLDWTWTGKIEQGIHVYTTTNYQYALAALPIGLVLGVILTFFLKETHARVVEEN